MQHSIQKYQHAFEQYLQDQKVTRSPETLYGPIEYILSLGGKRIRPLLCIMTCEMLQSDFQLALPQALAIEWFHNFTLVHDDIMDQAPIRRGKPTVHHSYSVNHGILSGDVMLIYTYRFLIEGLSESNIPKVLKHFNEIAIQICEGQQMDMDFESRLNVGLEEYLKMIEYKTAILLGASMSIGGMVAETSMEIASDLFECGKNMGLAFQLQDDFLDVFGQSDRTGKMKGGDILQNKKTYLYLKAIQLAEPKDKDELIALYSTTDANANDKKVERVTQLYQKYEIASHCKAVQKAFFNQGMKKLDRINIPAEKKLEIKTLFTDLSKRES